MVDERARDWLASQLGSRVVSLSQLTGGVSSQMYKVRTEVGDEAVLRRMTVEPWRRFADSLLRREYAVQQMLQNEPVHAPEPIVVDPDGSTAGEPSLLMSLMPGGLDITRDDDDDVRELADLLVRVHRFRPAPGSWPSEYQSWAFESKRAVPPWSQHDDAYAEAFARLRGPAPSYRRTFIHRDFYHGNVLWQEGRVTGLVDWVETSAGPADLDVAHCVSNTAGTHGVETALRFRAAYVDAGGVLDHDADVGRYWQLMDLVGFLPDGRTAEAASRGRRPA